MLSSCQWVEQNGNNSFSLLLIKKSDKMRTAAQFKCMSPQPFLFERIGRVPMLLYQEAQITLMMVCLSPLSMLGTEKIPLNTKHSPSFNRIINVLCNSSSIKLRVVTFLWIVLYNILMGVRLWHKEIVGKAVVLFLYLCLCIDWLILCAHE